MLRSVIRAVTVLLTAALSPPAMLHVVAPTAIKPIQNYSLQQPIYVTLHCAEYGWNETTMLLPILEVCAKLKFNPQPTVVPVSVPKLSAEQQLAEFFQSHQSLMVLTGAGISTDSGIPAYRDSNGEWLHSKPILYQDFVSEQASRQRYWARSMLGWPRMQNNAPNRGHHVISELQQAGFINALVTQNVDGMHQKAGSKNVIDLHGRIDEVICLECQQLSSRQTWQARLVELNPEWQTRVVIAKDKPDGDVEIEKANYHDFEVPACACGGIIKPDVVFFGESVASKVVDQCKDYLKQAKALLVIGSSLTVFSGFRFVRWAEEQQKPVAILTYGKTRGDDLASLKIEAGCSETLDGMKCLLT